MLKSILDAYGLQKDKLNVTTFGSGLINNTWRIKDARSDFILQRINDSVFTHREDVAHNIKIIAEYLCHNHPDYLFVSPIKTTAGEEMIFKKELGYFRMFPFIPQSHTIDVVQSPSEAYEA